MQKLDTVFILGVNGFPHGTARIEKLKLIGKSLVQQNIKVVLIGTEWGVFNKGEIPAKGNIEGINYIYTSGITHRPDSFLVRRWVKFYGKLKELIYVSQNKCDAAVVSIISGMFFPLFGYWILSRLFGFKIFYPHHEEPEVTLNSKSFYDRLNLFLFNKFAWKMLNGAFPISNYLADKINKKNPDLPVLRVPALVDFEIFDKVRKNPKVTAGKYFMYCGSIAYFEVIKFVIRAFELLQDAPYDLQLVISGEEKKKKKLYKRIKNSSKSDKIFIHGYLDYEVLVQKYIQASGLIIPMRSTIQDIARLPHKFGEYTASGNVIITNRVGDIPEYFKHMENALLAEKYDEKEFAENMNFVVQHPDKAQEIGRSGYQTGLQSFNYKSYGYPIQKFMEVN